VYTDFAMPPSQVLAITENREANARLQGLISLRTVSMKGDISTITAVFRF
jgi:hypothetical protein